jgi:predicted exporter
VAAVRPRPLADPDRSAGDAAATERNPLAEVRRTTLAHANGDRMVLLVANADDDRAKAAARELGSNALASEQCF